MRRILTGVATLAVAAVAVPGAATAAPTPDCSMMAATPQGSPLLIWCAATERSPSTGRVEKVRLWRSTGNGRWVEAKAANVVATDDPSPPQVSPRWAHDRTLYWATSAGLFASTDFGETFAPVSPLLTGSRAIVQRVLLVDGGTGVRGAVAGSGPDDVGYATGPGAAVVALGSPDDDVTYVPASGGAGVVAWDAVTTGAHRITAYRCTDLFVCAVPWFSLPASADGRAQHFHGAWRSPGAGGSEPTFLATRGGEQFTRVTLWRAGTSAAEELPAATAAIAALSNGLSEPTVTLAFSGTTVLLRVLSSADRSHAAHDRIYVSNDRGTSWRTLVAARRDARGRASGPRGWVPGAVSLSSAPALVARDGALLANVSDGTHYVFRCSRDGGRSWQPSCT